MELEYIIAIVAGGIFLILLAACILVYFHRRSVESERSAKIAEMYSDPELAIMDYDLASYDEETKRILAGGGAISDGQISIDDIIEDITEVSDDIEGLEEITGNYKPE